MSTCRERTRRARRVEELRVSRNGTHVLIEWANQHRAYAVPLDPDAARELANQIFNQPDRSEKALRLAARIVMLADEVECEP